MEADKRVSLLKIDEEFQSLLVPLSTKERVQLEENIRLEGCRDALVVWNDDILIDGHNRYEICQAHGIDFTVKPIDLPSREAAINWIINNQLGRRNLTAEQASYLRGKRYNREKLEAHRPEKRPQNDDVNPERTSERLAQEFKVGKATIERDGKYAQAVDTIEDTFGESVKQGILNREVKATKQDVQTLGELAEEVAVTDDMPPLLRKAEKMQELLDELPDDVQDYILDNNENEFTLLEEAVRKGHKREKLREKVNAYPRSDREIAFEKQAAEVWESIDDKGLPPLEKSKFKGMRDEALQVLRTPLRIPDLHAKRRWLRDHDESERMAWIVESREQAEDYVGSVERIKQQWKQAKSYAREDMIFHDADIGESSTIIPQKEVDYSRIFTHAIESLPARLQCKVFNDALERYHLSKLSDVDSEQDCATILLSLLDAKAKVGADRVFADLFGADGR